MPISDLEHVNISSRWEWKVSMISAKYEIAYHTTLTYQPELSSQICHNSLTTKKQTTKLWTAKFQKMFSPS